MPLQLNHFGANRDEQQEVELRLSTSRHQLPELTRLKMRCTPAKLLASYRLT